MKTVVLFIAVSLDGYISDKNGSVDWICGHNKNQTKFDAYSTFIKDIDTVIMGGTTYNQIVTELSPDKWPYTGLTSYVITKRNLPSTDEIIFTEKSPCDIVSELKQDYGKSIWICGGSSIIQQLMAKNLIDEFYISVIPTILGSGTRLFETIPQEIKLLLVDSNTYNGITYLRYILR